ncbi:endonuclease 3 [Neltuma alba]|uniref:endonuclease 3 n=1 Tax=Neltuma alba TaxID=207710 RepID=UPI0010A4ED17|nr:endonuclease 3-like [Prosopis alba]
MGKPLLWYNGRLFLLLLFMPAVLGWGDEGHYALCKLAEAYLSEDALFAVKKLLPASAEGDLASLCTWADDIKRQPDYRWSAALHFADTPDYKCNYEYCRDCHDFYGNKDQCVTGAIYNYTTQLRSTYAGKNSVLKYNLTEALLFLSHFVGDAHQPLHLGFIGDFGGNTMKLHWYDNQTNLHKVWDDMIIGSAMGRFYNSDLSTMIQAILANMKDVWSNDVATWQKCAHNITACTERYASESVSLACNFAYTNVTAGGTLGDEYFLSRLPIVEKRLAQGGVRLAATLNSIFVPHTRIAQA